MSKERSFEFMALCLAKSLNPYLPEKNVQHVGIKTTLIGSTVRLVEHH
jgi:hypothetical protein